MDSLDLIQTFREVARRGSFSATARAMDMSPANVSKYVAALEARFGVRLFNRTTRKVSLTDAGQLLYERSGPVLELVQLTESELMERATKPGGKLTVSAPHGLMQTLMPALLGRFLTRHPAVSLQLQITNRFVDLAEEAVDVALRIGPIPDANLIVKRILRVDLAVVATPAYWQAHGRPLHPRDLASHRTLTASPEGGSPAWRFVENGRPLPVPLLPHVGATDSAPLLPLALHDLGVAYLPRAAMAAALDSGALVSVLEEFVPQDVWLFAAYAQRRHNSAALAALLAFLDEERSNIGTDGVPANIPPMPARRARKGT